VDPARVSERTHTVMGSCRRPGRIAAAWLCASLVPSLLPAPEPVLPGGGYRTIEVKDGGAIAGVVKAQPPAEPPKLLHVTKDVDHCGRRIDDETLLVSPEGFLKNAVVSIEDVAEGIAIDTTARPRLENRACRFQPHVLAAAVGQKIEIVNGDPILHNTHAKLDGKLTLFNVALPIQNQKIPKTIREPGLLSLQCDAGHLWMSGFVIAFDHPYFAVTDERGAFAIGRIPPGAYRVRAWHEKLGGQVLEVKVEPGTTSDLVFDRLVPASP